MSRRVLVDLEMSSGVCETNCAFFKLKGGDVVMLCVPGL
jgi:hypothetical protein